MRISIVIPAHNEEKGLHALLPRIQACLNTCDATIDVIVVDDGSTDQTAEVARTHGATVIRRVERGGSGTARIQGILASNADYIAMIDADGTYNPADLPRLFQFLPEFDQVNGARQNEAGTWPWLRAPAKWLIQKLAEWVSGKHIADLNTGMKVFRRSTMLPYLWALSPGFSCVSSMTLAFLCNGHSVKYVPIDYHPRIGKSKFHPLRDTTKYVLTVLRVVTYFNPLRVFVPIALFLAMIGLVRIATEGLTSPAGVADADVITLNSSVIVFAIGLLADLIVKQRRFIHVPEPLKPSTSCHKDHIKNT